MSHFSVLVVGPNVDDQLAPYHEFECTGENDQYVIDVDETEETLAEKGDSTLSDVEFCSEWLSYSVVPFGEKPDTDGEHKYGYITVKEDGSLDKVIRRTNPNAKWDWYVEGGRWNGWAKDHSGQYIVSGKKRDFDFKKMYDDAYEQASKNHRAAILAIGDAEFKPLSYYLETLNLEIEQARALYWDQLAIKRLRESDNESFGWFIDTDIFSMSEFMYAGKIASQATRTYAIVKDGKWYAKGKMGWFGCSHDEKDDWPKTYKDILDSVSDDELLTVVDCHI